MLMVLGALLAVTVVVMVGRRVPRNIDSAHLGYVSERWSPTPSISSEWMTTAGSSRPPLRFHVRSSLAVRIDSTAEILPDHASTIAGYTECSGPEPPTCRGFLIMALAEGTPDAARILP